jgi:hypothetical protein
MKSDQSIGASNAEDGHMKEGAPIAVETGREGGHVSVSDQKHPQTSSDREAQDRRTSSSYCMITQNAEALALSLLSCQNDCI